MDEKDKFETDSIDLATFLKHAKKKINSGHRYDDRGRLYLIFDDIEKEKADVYLHQYLSSEWFAWDNTKKAFLKMLRNSR